MKLLLSLLISTLTFAISPGDHAPDFSLKNQEGKDIRLSSFKGKKVILEWYNEGCPFVRKHYDSKNMQQTQRYAIKNGYKWLTINSSNIGKQGYLKDSAAALNRLHVEKSNADHLLLDTLGNTGRAYNAKTTPEIFIINEEGRITYMGAIDSISSADKDDIKNATNYVKKAIDEVKAKKQISVAKTRPYGCSVKY